MSLESSLCLVIDNDRDWLGVILDLVRNTKSATVQAGALREALTAEVQELLDGLRVHHVDANLTRVLAVDALARVDWANITEHYRRKVEEGVTV